MILIPPIIEPVTLRAGGPSSLEHVDVLNGSVTLYEGAATTDWVFNLRGSATVSLAQTLDIGSMTTAVVIVPLGATPYKPTSFQIGGVGVTPVFQGGPIVSGLPNTHELFTLSVYRKTDGAFMVYVSQSRYI